MLKLQMLVKIFGRLENHLTFLATASFVNILHVSHSSPIENPLLFEIGFNKVLSAKRALELPKSDLVFHPQLDDIERLDSSIEGRTPI